MIGETRSNAVRLDLTLSVILFWTALLTGVLFWLPLVRGAIEGPDYQWAFSSTIKGRGVGGDYWFVVAGATFSLVMLFLGRRRVFGPFRWLLLAFHFSLAALVVGVAIVHPEQLFFEGASFGVRVPLAIVAPVLFSGFALLSLYWAATDERARGWATIRHGWSRASRIRVAIAVGLIPIQLLLLRMPLGSWQEMLGIGLIFWQWILINRAMTPPRDSS